MEKGLTTNLTCSTCGECQKELFRCSGCKVVLYCSREHQKQSWRSHKPECLRIQDWRKQLAKETASGCGGEEATIEETPPWAIRRIIECNRNRLASLDMESFSLKSLPMELILLAPTLTNLTLRYNYITYPSPSVLLALTALQYLDLRSNPYLKKLPDNLAKSLPNLTTLIISYCEEIPEIPPSLGYQLLGLEVDGCRALKGIPFELYGTGRLKEIIDKQGVYSLNCLGWDNLKGTPPTEFWVHLPTLVNISMGVVKRHHLEQGKQDIFPGEMWQRLQNDGNLCSYCNEVYYGPCFMERVTSLYWGKSMYVEERFRLHCRSCSVACDQACRATDFTDPGPKVVQRISDPWI